MEGLPRKECVKRFYCLLAAIKDADQAQDYIKKLKNSPTKTSKSAVLDRVALFEKAFSERKDRYDKLLTTENQRYLSELIGAII
mmetsp:Transcript_19958/g.26943  ORF Transcript_19958/g.26943 Transcript_19958/m.26943 type:complete len:84 (+) Transcript_19958:317-568(+)|eukprot:CAMPEP_0185573094 /NCGR_PEP_ID=MMETSP0434-20130131/4896_1 /TAXON_ID=626734 ORGANISM="Favella taraikaensis, Strain Fe Narragansett Bay" /NCGR_SAMPLE_ID=MMETSP0434 /ASSEMBLY_ACC=CAM_ASM_000379 /LENGTH=83 /DNA_ID=CAMNT_0028189215 /DNA_START=310 /DNA_END=561 /DNA_ORIENTATION=+